MPLILLLLVCFSDRVSNFCPSWPQTMILLPLPHEKLGSQVYHHT
jgi:hypothetical protein